MWLTCYFSQKEGAIGVFLGSDRTNQLAIEIGKRLDQEREAITNEISLPLEWTTTEFGKVEIKASKRFPDLRDPALREEELAWFRVAINSFINSLRPRIASLIRELTEAAGPSG